MPTTYLKFYWYTKLYERTFRQKFFPVKITILKMISKIFLTSGKLIDNRMLNSEKVSVAKQNYSNFIMAFFQTKPTGYKKSNNLILKNEIMLIPSNLFSRKNATFCLLITKRVSKSGPQVWCQNRRFDSGMYIKDTYNEISI